MAIGIPIIPFGFIGRINKGVNRNNREIYNIIGGARGGAQDRVGLSLHVNTSILSNGFCRPLEWSF